MLDAFKVMWEERSDNFYENVQRIKLYLFTIQYVIATGDIDLWYDMYGVKLPSEG